VKVEKVISIIESIADPSYSASWDLSGIQIASNRKDVYKLALCLDPDPLLLKEIFQWGADFVLTHHPITLSPKLPNELDLYHEILSLFFRADVWLYAAHTSLDVQINGPAGWLARELSFIKTEAIEPIGDNLNIGFGLIGTLPESMSYEDFVVSLKQILKRDSWLESGTVPGKVEVVAYCPGSGMSLAKTAFLKGADIFISGELKYHSALEIKRSGMILDVGHFILEERMMEVWADILKEELKGVEVSFFKGEDPIKWGS